MAEMACRNTMGMILFHEGHDLANSSCAPVIEIERFTIPARMHDDLARQRMVATVVRADRAPSELWYWSSCTMSRSTRRKTLALTEVVMKDLLQRLQASHVCSLNTITRWRASRPGRLRAPRAARPRRCAHLRLCAWISRRGSTGGDAVFSSTNSTMI